MSQPLHKSTAQVMAVLNTLLEHGGWLSQRALSQAAGVPRATLAPMLEELAAGGWVECEPFEDSLQYAIGPGLPRIGIAWLRLQARHVERLQARVNAGLSDTTDALQEVLDG